MSFSKYSVAAILVALFILSGCNHAPKKPANMPDLYSCKIAITQEEKPLKGAVVRLEPKTGGSIGWRCDGKTNAKGVAEIATGIDFKGVPEGEYVVCVSKTELEPSAFPDKAPTDPVEREKWRVGVNAEAITRKTYRYVKPEFNDAKKTSHSITIVKGKNEATFDVGEPIKEEVK